MGALLAVPLLALLLLWREQGSCCAPVIATYPPDYGVCDCYYTGFFLLWLGLGRLQGCTTTGLSRKICKVQAVAPSPCPCFIQYILAWLWIGCSFGPLSEKTMENTLAAEKSAYPCSLPKDKAFRAIVVCVCVCVSTREWHFGFSVPSQKRASPCTTVTALDEKHMSFNTLWLYGCGWFFHYLFWRRMPSIVQ